MASNGAAEKVLKTGHLFKQGGSYRNWKMRYFILRRTTLSYYAAEGDKKAKGVIDLTQGRGIRTKEQCQLEEEEWPNAATEELAFGLAVKDRTFYIYGCDQAAVDDWKSVLQERIKKVGNFDSNYNEDCQRKQESTSSKIVHGGGRLIHRAKYPKKQIASDDHEEHPNDLNSKSDTADSNNNNSAITETAEIKESSSNQNLIEDANEADGATEECIYQNTTECTDEVDEDSIYQNTAENVDGDVEECIYQNTTEDYDEEDIYQDVADSDSS